jgi:hypothetical protein
MFNSAPPWYEWFDGLDGAAMFRILARFTVLLFVASALSLVAQSPTSADVVLDKAAYTAGEQIRGTITLNVPSPCSAYVSVRLTRGGAGGGGTEGIEIIDLASIVAKGGSKISVFFNTPLDNPGGEYAPSPTGSYMLCGGYSLSHPITVSGDLRMTMIPVPDTNAYPTQAKVEFNVSQKQFLETKAHELDRLLVRFANGIEQYPSATDPQKQFLVSIIESAQLALNDAEGEYRKQILKPNESIPVFFEDFREHYRDLEVEVKAPKTIGALPTPHLVLAQLNTPQLKKRPSQQRPPAKTSITLTPDAEATSHLIEDNKKAYTYVEETGGASFTTTLMSIPDGARVSYRRTTQPDFIDYPTPTNVTTATFPMAYLLFRFHKDNCGEDQFLRLNPWDDPKAVIKMEFTKCH